MDHHTLEYEPLEYTGERMVPEAASPQIFWEHVYRYRFAAQFVRGKRVLDIACGEGYGAAALARSGAVGVIGVDISPEACEHARRKYGVDARPGSAEDIPLPDEAVDIVVSFETVEHVPSPGNFLQECARVLAPGGLLVVSTPNKEIFDSTLPESNPFHCSEMDEREFHDLLASHFSVRQILKQCFRSVPLGSAATLAAETSPWQRVRGFGRLRQSIRGLLCPHVVGPLEEKYKQSPVEAILKTESPFSSWVNPYAIRRGSRNPREEFIYLIAVAQKAQP